MKQDMKCEIAIEDFARCWQVFYPLFNRHYDEQRQNWRHYHGIELPPFEMQVANYLNYNETGFLRFFTVRCDGVPKGYLIVFLTSDTRNGEFVATEDALYMHPDCRNGLGRRLVKIALGHLKNEGVKRVFVSAAIDRRVEILGRRMGFKTVAQQMAIDLEAADHVQPVDAYAARSV